MHTSKHSQLLLVLSFELHRVMAGMALCSMLFDLPISFTNAVETLLTTINMYHPGVS